MRYLTPYNLFISESSKNSEIDPQESEFTPKEWEDLSFEEKKAKIFSIYPPIPLEKRAAADAIRKIKIVENSPNSKLESNSIDFPDKRLIDRLRWHQYFTSLIQSKEIRGHNFEGLIAGLYGGSFTTPGHRGDLIIDGKIVSVKSLNDVDEAPVLGSVKKSLSEFPEILGRIGNTRSIYQVFRNKVKGEEDLRKQIWEAAFKGVNNVDYFLIAYFVEPSEKSTGTIFINIFSNKEMYDFIEENGLNTPKQGGSKYQMRISSTYKSAVQNPISIKVPKIDNEDLDNIWSKTARSWGKVVFGDKISNKMRTDTIEDIIADKDNISIRMSEN